MSYIAGLGAAIAVAMEILKPVGKRNTMIYRSVRTEVLVFLGWESSPFYIYSATSLSRN